MTTKDAVAVIQSDHRRIEQLFRSFESARGVEAKARLASEISRELSIHASIEEQQVYPRLRALVERDPKEPQVLLALEEHHVAKLALSEIRALPPASKRFDAKMRVLIANVRHHVEEEERELLPAMRRAFGREELEELGTVLQRLKQIAPTRPHPTAPDEPPGSIVAGLAAGAYDRSLDAVERGVELAAEGSRRLVDAALRRGEDAVRRVRGQVTRGVAEARREVQPGALERRLRRGGRTARQAQQRLGEGIEQVGREIQPATVH
jgi:hemerythrin superfamily protein